MADHQAKFDQPNFATVRTKSHLWSATVRTKSHLWSDLYQVAHVEHDEQLQDLYKRRSDVSTFTGSGMCKRQKEIEDVCTCTLSLVTYGWRRTSQRRRKIFEEDWHNRGRSPASNVYVSSCCNDEHNHYNIIILWCDIASCECLPF